MRENKISNFDRACDIRSFRRVHTAEPSLVKTGLFVCENKE